MWLGAQAAPLTGAGSTSAKNLINLFIVKYNESSQQKVIYVGAGPNDGLKKINSRKVDFAVSVVPILPFELKKNHLMQFPFVVLGFVVAVNIPGVRSGEMVLSGDLLADIFRGKIKYWDNEEIQKMNPNLNFPHIPIVPVQRADLAGSTFTFTNYLSKVNLIWLLLMGDGYYVDWPSGISTNGGEGVARKILQVPGAIGYDELSTAVQYRLSYIDMFNRSGKRVHISRPSLQSAVDQADFKNSEDFYLFFTNQGGVKSWPLLAGSYILLRTDSDRETTKKELDFFYWCFTHSNSVAKKINAIELPAQIVSQIEQEWQDEFNWKKPPG
jgi:phosphate transport system substrate-binding protein